MRYYCEQDRSRIEISESGQEVESKSGQSNTTVEWIDVGALIETAEENEDGDVWRTGSSSITRRCGKLTLEVSGGYFNANPQGEMGAAEDYALVEISDDSGNSTGRMAIGTCIPSVSRYSARVDCPKDWVVRLEASVGAQGMSIRTQHSYEDYRQPIKTTAPPQAH